MIKYKWLIIQGCPRSGTTVLFKLLNSHENIALTKELNLNKHIKKRSLTKTYQNIFENKKNIEKVIYFGDKLPEYYYTNIYKKILNLKIIHISRDPIDTINSMMNRRKNSKKGLDPTWNNLFSIKDFCRDWIRAWNHINKNKNNPNYLHIKYEDLILDTKKESEKIAKFLDTEPNFNIDFIKNKEISLNLNKKELKTIRKYFKAIIKDWILPLPKLEERYPKIKATSAHYFSKKIKTILWEISKIIKKI
jgi:hypothetical protein